MFYGGKRLILTAAVVMVAGACSGVANEPATTTTLATSATTATAAPAAPTTTTTPPTTTTTPPTTTPPTTTPPTTTTLPEVTEASIDGTWTAVIEYSTTELADGPPDERAYTFVSDCSHDPCEITGEVEIGIPGTTEVETRTTPIERVGSSYTWTFIDEETVEDSGTVLCVFTHNRRVTLTVDEAEAIDGVWTAAHMSGEFRNPVEVTEQAEGVLCDASEEVVGTVTLERSG